MECFVDVICRWPSAQDLAADLGVSSGKIALWKHRNSIPPNRWLDVQAAATKRGYGDVTLALLARLATVQRLTSTDDASSSADLREAG